MLKPHEISPTYPSYSSWAFGSFFTQIGSHTLSRTLRICERINREVILSVMPLLLLHYASTWTTVVTGVYTKNPVLDFRRRKTRNAIMEYRPAFISAISKNAIAPDTPPTSQSMQRTNS